MTDGALHEFAILVSNDMCGAKQTAEQVYDAGYDTPNGGYVWYREGCVFVLGKDEEDRVFFEVSGKDCNPIATLTGDIHD